MGAGVIWVKPLNYLRMGALPVGFWVAQQGAVVGFVVLVFIYAIWMNYLDNQYAKSQSPPPDRDFDVMDKSYSLNKSNSRQL